MRWLFDGTVLSILSHIKRVLIHKYYIIITGFKLRVPIVQILLHDLSKLWFSEAGPYARQFFQDEKRPEEFKRAWLHHQNYNKHHWEYHIIRSQKGSTTPEAMRMPRRYAREMVADWMAASKAYEDTWDFSFWLGKNWKRMILHPETRRYVSGLLKDLSYDMSKFE